MGPVIATALVLMAVFIPIAFLPGITGQLYRQFALTIAVSVALSALNALTLTPALCALLLRPAGADPEALAGPDLERGVPPAHRTATIGPSGASSGGRPSRWWCCCS